MNKKIGIFMVFVLLVGAVFLSACQNEAVGRKVSFKAIGEEGDGGDGPRIIENIGSCCLQGSGECDHFVGSSCDEINNKQGGSNGQCGDDAKCTDVDNSW